jgi:hypothetical protein
MSHPPARVITKETELIESPSTNHSILLRFLYQLVLETNAPIERAVLEWYAESARVSDLKGGLSPELFSEFTTMLGLRPRTPALLSLLRDLIVCGYVSQTIKGFGTTHKGLAVIANFPSDTPTTRPVQVRPTTYTISVLPEDLFDSYLFSITVEYRRAYQKSGRWAVCHLGRYLSRAGTWDEDSYDDASRDAWLDEHRFEESEALDLARSNATSVKINGITPEGLVALSANRS